MSLLPALLLGCLLPVTLSAQPSAGTVQGRVYNPTLNQYVRNAEVRLEGSNQVTYTESDGSFRFDHVPAGQATIVVAFTGYNTVTESFTVSDGAAAVREINLTPAGAGSAATNKDGVVKLEAFTVSSEPEGN
jgi:iron complex outermembrane receptor protein